MKGFYFLIILLFSFSCKQPFSPPEIIALQHYLVVEGSINTGEGNTIITLTRTRNLSDTGYLNVSGVPDSLFELHAQVEVEDNAGNHYSLPEMEKGQYGDIHLNLNTQRKYRLHIKTENGAEYVSNYVSANPAPVIDSVYWNLENEGLQVYMNVHNNSSASQYYRWSYKETWEFHTYFHSALKYNAKDTTLIKRSPREYIDTCWRKRISRNILIDNTTKLMQNRLSHVPLVSLSSSSEVLSVLYSLHIQVHSISKEEFQFWQIMKKNTEQLGTVFGPQPSIVRGNIQCISNPKELVIGFIGAGGAATKRIWISNQQLPNNGNDNFYHCALQNIANDKDTIAQKLGGLHPLFSAVNYIKDLRGNITGYKIARRRCADCTQRGTTVKPTFWP